MSGDILIAAKSAKFKLVFGNQLGIISDVGASWFVPNLLSRARANGLAMLGDDLSAEQAEEWGLLWKTFNDDILMDEAMKIASKLADGAIEGLKAIVHSHDHALISSLDDQLEYEKKVRGDPYSNVNRGWAHKPAALDARTLALWLERLIMRY